MKKNFLALTFAAISAFSFSALAQQPACPEPCKPDAQCPAVAACQNNADCNKIDCKKADCKKADCKGPRACMFEGLDLTDAQKAQLKELRKNNAQKCREGRLEAKKKYLQEVKAIVGPEKYVTFLEKAFINNQGPRRADGAKLQKNKKMHNRPLCPAGAPACKAQPANK